VLPDDLKGLYKNFGIDLAETNGEDSWSLAVPARFIIDTAGVVRYVRADPDYTRRPEPEETLEELKRLAT
jgi:peroxiredoxin